VASSDEDRCDREAKRCLHDAGEFRHEHVDWGRILRRADVPVERILEAVRRHGERILDPSRRGVLAGDRRALVTWVEPGDGGPPLCVKEFRRPTARQRFDDALRGTRARRAWLAAHACRARGLATPPPFGILEGRGRCWLVTEYLADAASLRDWIADHRPARDAGERRRWRALLDATAAFVARLHQHRLRHRDLSAKNLLVREQEGSCDIALIDLSDLRIGRAPSRRFKIRNLGQLAQTPVPPSRSDALRFWRRYLETHPELDDPRARSQIAAIARERREHWLAGGGPAWLEERRRLREAD
jgi:hypothetical protein